MNASEDRLPLEKRQAGYPQITQISPIRNSRPVGSALSSLLLNLWNLCNLRILNSPAFVALHGFAYSDVVRDSR
jgi:hypothetical protein